MSYFRAISVGWHLFPTYLVPSTATSIDFADGYLEDVGMLQSPIYTFAPSLVDQHTWTRSRHRWILDVWEKVAQRMVLGLGDAPTTCVAVSDGYAVAVGWFPDVARAVGPTPLRAKIRAVAKLIFSSVEAAGELDGDPQRTS